MRVFFMLHSASKTMMRAAVQTVYIKTFGCQMNEYDSSRMLDLLQVSHGLTPTQDPQQADLILLNTCSVREKAQEKVFSQLGQWRPLKTRKPGLVIGVGGCVASQEGAMILKRAPFVDMVFGPQTLHRLPAMLDQAIAKQQRSVDVSFPEIEKFDCLPPVGARGVKAFVSIMEGCSKYCSFCIVPYTRGTEFSRPFDDVIHEVHSLAARGVREINLLGQNVNGYVGARHTGGTMGFAELLHYVAAVDGVERVRYTTSHPINCTDAQASAHGEITELAAHLHLPVQSGADRILKLMKRGYTADAYCAWIDKLRAARPDISLSADFIVGFPGETDADFAATMELIDRVGYDQSYSFIYSPRPGTPAAELPDDVPPRIKKARLARLQARINAAAADISAAMVGTTQQVLVEGVSRDAKRAAQNSAAETTTAAAVQMTGRTENNRVVNFVGDHAMVGKLLPVTITEALPNSLRGIVV